MIQMSCCFGYALEKVTSRPHSLHSLAQPALLCSEVRSLGLHCPPLTEPVTKTNNTYNVLGQVVQSPIKLTQG